jgi:hypothetical protein
MCTNLRSRQSIYYTFFWVLTATCLKLVRTIVRTESKGDGRNYQLSRATLMKVLRFPLSFSVDCGEQGRVAEHETTDTGGAERRRSKLVQTFPRKDHCGGQFLLDIDYENELSSRRADETIDCLSVRESASDSGNRSLGHSFIRSGSQPSCSKPQRTRPRYLDWFVAVVNRDYRRSHLPSRDGLSL